MLGEHLLEIGLIELLARDVREYGSITERNNGSTHEAMTGRKQQLTVLFQCAHDIERILAGLLQGIAHPHGAAVRQQLDVCLVGRQDCLQAPVLHLEHEQAVRGMDDDEVRMPVARAYREVVPNDRVLFEEILETHRQPLLAAGVETRIAYAGDQDCHVTFYFTFSTTFPRARPFSR